MLFTKSTYAKNLLATIDPCVFSKLLQRGGKRDFLGIKKKKNITINNGFIQLAIGNQKIATIRTCAFISIE